MDDKQKLRLCARVLRMLLDRTRVHRGTEFGSAYASAAWMLHYALTGNVDCLEQFDCYKEEK